MPAADAATHTPAHQRARGRTQAQREAKWRAVLQDTQSLHGVQSDMERRKW